MKELKGTEKQVAWAEDIRKKAIDWIEGRIQQYKDRNRENDTLIFNKNIEAGETMLEDMKEMLDKVEDASTIIGMRNKLAAESLQDIYRAYFMRLDLSRK